MTKAELIKETAKRVGLTQIFAECIINAALDVTAEALADGQEVKLHQFGAFKVKERQPRMSRNFKTGEAVFVPGCNTVHFTPAAALKQAVNTGGITEE